MTFTFTDDYKNEFKRYVDELFTYAKVAGRYAGYDLADRAERMQLIDELIESYIAATGQRPDSVQLDRLATLCLREELTDRHPDKMSREEFPIMSDTQQEERYYDEASYKLAEEVGIDGRDYRPQTRLSRRKLKRFTK